MSDYLKPLPKIDARNQPHWEGAREGRLMIQACSDCNALRYPFSSMCPHCQSTNSEWRQTSGKGTIWSWCEFHRVYFKGFDMPYNVVLVQLDEGPKLYSNLLGMDTSKLRIGMRVRAVYDKVTEEVTLVKFEEDRS